MQSMWNDIFTKRGPEYTFKRTNHIEELPFKCSLCCQRFKTKPLLQYHETLNHSTDGKHQAFQCDQCSASFRYENKLDKHKTFHAGENAYECKTCGKGFANSTDLWNHDSTHSEEYT